MELLTHETTMLCGVECRIYHVVGIEYIVHDNKEKRTSMAMKDPSGAAVAIMRCSDIPTDKAAIEWAKSCQYKPVAEVLKEATPCNK